MGNCRTGLMVAVLVGWAGTAFAACQPETVQIRGSDGTVMQFRVEVADDGAERSQGLMFRERMASSAGMLFVYDKPQRAQFWMENTLIPLDMIFADAAGRVTTVHANAIPRDRTPIDGGSGVQFVLEINGGLASRLGIVKGSELRHPAIDQTNAAWPCD